MSSPKHGIREIRILRSFVGADDEVVSLSALEHVTNAGAGGDIVVAGPAGHGIDTRAAVGLVIAGVAR
jgi:hypothetical protein